MSAEKKRIFLCGMRDGIPIGLGYFAVAFTLGIYARNVGLSAVQATVSSLLTHASAGQYAGFSMIGRQAGMIEVIVMTLVINARYLLMSTALSQRLGERTTFLQRLGLGFCITDEIFGISLAYPAPLNPVYTYGAMCVASPGWALGTLLGPSAWACTACSSPSSCPPPAKTGCWPGSSCCPCASALPVTGCCRVSARACAPSCSP